jgi:hypothetical protein
MLTLNGPSDDVAGPLDEPHPAMEIATMAMAVSTTPGRPALVGFIISFVSAVLLSLGY